MTILIRHTDTHPIYEQIARQIKNAFICGELAENSPLPSIRNLAKDLQVSVITTKRAYDELEKDGYIVTVPAKGCFVAAGNRQAFEQQVYAELQTKMKEASILARQAGITTAELKHILDEVWEELI